MEITIPSEEQIRQAWENHKKVMKSGILGSHEVMNFEEYTIFAVADARENNPNGWHLPNYWTRTYPDVFKDTPQN